MAKRVVTARVETELADAVAAKADEHGESVTDVIVEAFRAYLGVRPAAKGRCPHPKSRIHRGLCHACGMAVP